MDIHVFNDSMQSRDQNLDESHKTCQEPGQISPQNDKKKL